MEGFVKYEWTKLSHDEQIAKSAELLENMERRRSIRSFSSEEVPREAIINAIKIASSAPSGANKQPWTFAWSHHRN